MQYLLEGSVRRQGKDLRITAQLIDAMHDVYLWAETYRGTIEDIFDIQEKVAAEIVQALQLRLSPDEKQILKKRFTENTEAYQLYLQGRFFWNKRSEEGMKIAIKYFEKAIEKDPQYALAWAGIADSYSVLGEYGNIPRRELYPKAEAAVIKALEIDDRLAEVHTSRASLLMLGKWDWVNSEKEFKLALELNPNYATAHHWYSQWLLDMGRLEEALRMISRAAELDPVSQAIHQGQRIGLLLRSAVRQRDRDGPKDIRVGPELCCGPSPALARVSGQGTVRRSYCRKPELGKSHPVTKSRPPFLWRKSMRLRDRQTTPGNWLKRWRGTRT